MTPEYEGDPIVHDLLAQLDTPALPADFPRRLWQRVDDADPVVDQPAEPAVVRPSGLEIGKSNAAHARNRLNEIHNSNRKKVTAAVAGLGDAVAEVESARARYALAQRQVRYAELDSGAVRALPPTPGGSRYDPHSRAFGRFALFMILAVCVIGDFLVGRSTLLIFRLGFGFTETLAMMAAVIQTVSAQTVGRLLRRAQEAIDPDELLLERRKTRLLIALTTVIVIALGLVRAAAQGYFILAVLSIGVLGASTVLAIIVSYLYANTRLDAISKTDNKIYKVGNKAVNHGRDVLRAEAKRVGAINNLQAVAADVVARIDLVYTNHGIQPDSIEPAWVRQMRTWADGQNLPFLEGQHLPPPAIAVDEPLDPLLKDQ